MQCDKIAPNGVLCEKTKRHRGVCSNRFCSCGKFEKAKSATVCRNCANKYCLSSHHRRRAKNPAFRHDATEQEFHDLWNKQQGRCALCQISLTLSILHVDHSHDREESGVSLKDSVRGLLCNYCNRSLGYVEKFIKRGLVEPSAVLREYFERKAFS